METVVATINEKNYYLVVGFDVCSFVSESVSKDGFYKEDGEPANLGKLARETLALAAREHQPDMNWSEFIENLPPSGWIEVWTAFDAVMDIVEAKATDPSREKGDPVNMASDAYIGASGGHAA